MIGLCGAHRTGKTTLADAFAKEHDMVFLKTSASQVFKDMGLNPSVDYHFDIRMDVQERILKEFEKQYLSMDGKPFVTDRTPIDMIAYTLADVRQQTLTQGQNDRLEEYVAKCISVTNRHFAILVVVQPGIKVKHEEGKASLSPMYIEHVAQIVMGVTVSEDIHATHFYIPRRTIDLSKRIECVSRAYSRTVERHQQRIEAAAEAGNPIVFH